jgi:hypothetical protein
MLVLLNIISFAVLIEQNDKMDSDTFITNFYRIKKFQSCLFRALLT